MTSTLKLLGCRVLIKPDEVAKEKVISGIIIPPSAGKKEVPDMGIVVSVAPGKWGFKVGDRVLFGKFDMEPLELDGVEHRIGDVEHVLAVIG